MNNWTFVAADDDALDEVLSGRGIATGFPWPGRVNRRVRANEDVGALVRRSDHDGSERPAALVISGDTGRRLFGRYAQLRSHFAPLSAWTHIIDWTQLEQLHDDERPAQLEGFEASWVGLCVAEALMLSDRPLSQMKIAACLATPTYAIARTHALWQGEPIEAVLSRYDQSQRLLRATDSGPNRLRQPLMDIWRALIGISVPLPRGPSHDLRAVTEALITLRVARASGRNEAQAVLDALGLPSARFLDRLDTMTPETRVKEFDRIIAELDQTSQADAERRISLQFLAGYLATVAAGGAPSLGLAERLSSRWPQVTAWAYVIGGIGENVTWTSSFDGLGRLVARELMRPFRLDEAPTSDFALAEAAVLVDRALKDPLVHLRIKQSRVLSVALMPGVNIAVPFAEPAPAEARSAPPAEPRRTAPRRLEDPLAILADLLAPYIHDRLYPNEPAPVSELTRKPSGGRRGTGRARPTKKDPELSFPGDAEGSR